MVKDYPLALLPDLPNLEQLDRHRLDGYYRYLAFYNGEHWPQWQISRTGHRLLVMNYIRTMIDKLTSYLMSGMTFALSGDSPEQVAAAEQALHEVYHRNNLAALDMETEADCAILGDGCYKVTWDGTQRRVRVTAPDMRSIYAWWVPDDPSTVYRVIARYQLPPQAVAMLYPDFPSGASSLPYAAASSPSLMSSPSPPAVSFSHSPMSFPWKRESMGGGQGMVTIVEDWTADYFALYIGGVLYRSLANPYGFLPFVIFPNLREPKQFWGVSDMKSLVPVQEELNRAATQLSRVLEISGNPIAVFQNVADARDIPIEPGTTIDLGEEGKVYLLDLLKGGGVRLHIEYIDLLFRIMHDMAEVPRSAFGSLDRTLSGVALELDLQPLLQKVQRKRLLRTPLYEQRNRMILDVLAAYAPEKVGHVSGLCHEIIWAPPLPKDQSRLIQDEIALVSAALHSRQTAMTNLGVLAPGAEIERMAVEGGQ